MERSYHHAASIIPLMKFDEVPSERFLQPRAGDIFTADIQRFDSSRRSIDRKITSRYE